MKRKKKRYEVTQKLVTISRLKSTKEEPVFVEPESVEEGLVLLAGGSAASRSREREEKPQELEWWEGFRHCLGPLEEGRKKRGRK